MIVMYAVVSSFEKLNPKIPDPVLSSKNGEIKIKRYKIKIIVVVVYTNHCTYSVRRYSEIKLHSASIISTAQNPLVIQQNFIFRKITGK